MTEIQESMRRHYIEKQLMKTIKKAKQLNIKVRCNIESMKDKEILQLDSFLKQEIKNQEKILNQMQSS